MSGSGAPLRVVVADDEEVVRTMLSLQLAGVDGIEVVGVAADGRAALEMCAELAPDAIVVDLLMPHVNGFQVIAALQERRDPVAIVAYTAVAGEFVRNEMSRLSVPLVLKSGDVGPLVAALREAAAGGVSAG